MKSKYTYIGIIFPALILLGLFIKTSITDFLCQSCKKTAFHDYVELYKNGKFSSLRNSLSYIEESQPSNNKESSFVVHTLQTIGILPIPDQEKDAIIKKVCSANKISIFGDCLTISENQKHLRERSITVKEGSADSYIFTAHYSHKPSEPSIFQLSGHLDNQQIIANIDTGMTFSYIDDRMLADKSIEIDPEKSISIKNIAGKIETVHLSDSRHNLSFPFISIEGKFPVYNSNFFSYIGMDLLINFRKICLIDGSWNTDNHCPSRMPVEDRTFFTKNTTPYLNGLFNSNSVKIALDTGSKYNFLVVSDEKSQTNTNTNGNSMGQPVLSQNSLESGIVTIGSTAIPIEYKVLYSSNQEDLGKLILGFDFFYSLAAFSFNWEEMLFGFELSPQASMKGNLKKDGSDN